METIMLARFQRYIKPVAFVLAGVLLGVAFAPATVQAAVNYFNTTKVVGAYGTVYCPRGWHMTGGGVKTLPPNRFQSQSVDDQYALTGSYPYGNGWHATATEVYGTYNPRLGWQYRTYAYKPRVYAVCAS